MESIGAFDAKTHFSALLERVEKGETVIVTRHGKPVARLSPLEPNATTEERERLIQGLKLDRAQHTLAGLNWRDLRDEGRK